MKKKKSGKAAFKNDCVEPMYNGEPNEIIKKIAEILYSFHYKICM